MPRAKRAVLEYRTYDLPADFPLFVLSGDAWRISPVPSKRLHIHNCLEIGLCHSESGFMLLGEQQTAFSSGCVSVIARNVPHTTWSSPGVYSQWSYLYLDIEAILGSFSMELLPDMNVFYKMLTNCHFILPPDEYPWAKPIIQSVLTEFENKGAGYRGSIRGLLLSFVIRIMRLYSDGEQSLKDKNISVLSPALEYMHRCYDQTFSMEQLAELCHISPTHFRRLFGAQMGESPLHFLHQLRVMQSCRLLRTTNKTIAEIATLAGYSSLCCYNQHFRRFMGCTPSAWRKAGGQEKPALVTYTGWMEAERLENEQSNEK